VPEIPVGPESGIFKHLVGDLLRVSEKAGEGATEHGAPTILRRPPRERVLSHRPRETSAHTALRKAVAKGRDTGPLTRRVLAEAGPEGEKALETMDHHKVEVEYSKGGGSFHDHENNTVHIDLKGGHPGPPLVHELTHSEWAHTKKRADPSTTRRAEYIDLAAAEETDAQMRQINANIHLQNTNQGVRIPDVALQKEFMDGYDSAGSTGGRQAVYDAFRNGLVRGSVTHKSYVEISGEAWDRHQVREILYGPPPPTT
jgi:hypothetical protein